MASRSSVQLFDLAGASVGRFVDVADDAAGISGVTTANPVNCIGVHVAAVSMVLPASAQFPVTESEITTQAILCISAIKIRLCQTMITQTKQFSFEISYIC